MYCIAQFDRQWESDPGYVFYDFNKEEDIPADMTGSFDLIVI